MSDDPIEIVDVPAEQRYEARRGGEQLGVVTYIFEPGVITFTHTETDPRFEGQGVGSALARGVLDDARARGLKVQPVCPFIHGWIRRHPEYQDLTDG